MKYKLVKKTDKLQGNFTLDKVYELRPYVVKNNSIVTDDNNKKHIIENKSYIFREHFISVNKERKEKLKKIDGKN